MTIPDEPGGNTKIPLVLPKKVAILYSDVKREYFGTEQEYLSEEGADIYAGEVAKYVAKMGIDVTTIAGDDQLGDLGADHVVLVSRQRDGGQDGDDGDNNHQLDKGKALVVLHVHGDVLK